MKKKVAKKNVPDEKKILESLKIAGEIYRADIEVSPEKMQGAVMIIRKNKDGTWFQSGSVKNVSLAILLHLACSTANVSYLDGALGLAKMSEAGKSKVATTKTKKSNGKKK